MVDHENKKLDKYGFCVLKNKNTLGFNRSTNLRSASNSLLDIKSTRTSKSYEN